MAKQLELFTPSFKLTDVGLEVMENPTSRIGWNMVNR